MRIQNTIARVYAKKATAHAPISSDRLKKVAGATRKHYSNKCLNVFLILLRVEIMNKIITILAAASLAMSTVA
ncbi:hypothetical protein, partial [Janthinobacterium agaricidamnosum]